MMSWYKQEITMPLIENTCLSARKINRVAASTFAPGLPKLHRHMAKELKEFDFSKIPLGRLTEIWNIVVADNMEAAGIAQTEEVAR